MITYKFTHEPSIRRVTGRTHNIYCAVAPPADMTSFPTGRVVLLALVALSCMASVSALDPPSSKPKQSIGKYATLFLKPSKTEVDVDAYAFVIPVSTIPTSAGQHQTNIVNRTSSIISAEC